MSSQDRKTDMEKSVDKKINEAEEMIKKRVSDFYSNGVPVVNIWMALSFFAKMKYHQVGFTSPCTIMYLVCLVVSSLTEVIRKIKLVTQHSRRRWMLAYLSTVLQISTATALMLFFDTTHALAVVLPFCLVLVLFIYFFCQMFGPGKVLGLRWLPFKELLNRRFEMSALVVAPSVAGLSGKVLGYMDGSSTNLTAGRTVVAPECFLFYSAVSGLLGVHFCTVPPSLSYTKNVEDMANVYIPSIAYMALLFLVVATVVAAEKILQQYVYLVCCPIAIIALFLCLCDNPEGSSSIPRQDPSAVEGSSLNDDREKESSKYFSVAILPILLAIMAIHSRYGGIRSTVSLSWTWKAFVSSALCSILSHTVRIVILDQMAENKRYEMSRKFWNYWSFASITITVAFAVFVICLHPDEVKNIF